MITYDLRGPPGDDDFSDSSGATNVLNESLSKNLESVIAQSRSLLKLTDIHAQVPNNINAAPDVANDALGGNINDAFSQQVTKLASPVPPTPSTGSCDCTQAVYGVVLRLRSSFYGATEESVQSKSSFKQVNLQGR